MWGDRWVPMKILNTTKKPVTVRCNAKIADVYPCVAVEDLPISQGMSRPQEDQAADPVPKPDATCSPLQQLRDRGLADMNIEGCEVSDEWKQQLANLVLTYQDIFSKDKLDCGVAKEFVNRIHIQRCCLRWS